MTRIHAPSALVVLALAGTALTLVPTAASAGGFSFKPKLSFSLPRVSLKGGLPKVSLGGPRVSLGKVGGHRISIGAPSLGVPGLGVPGLRVPGLGVPKIGVPKIGVPKLAVPKIGIPKLGGRPLGAFDPSKPLAGIGMKGPSPFAPYRIGPIPPKTLAGPLLPKLPNPITLGKLGKPLPQALPKPFSNPIVAGGFPKAPPGPVVFKPVTQQLARPIVVAPLVPTPPGPIAVVPRYVAPVVVGAALAPTIVGGTPLTRRPLPASAVCTATSGSFVSVAFLPNVSSDDIDTFVKAYNVTIVDGPAADGTYRIKLSCKPLPAGELTTVIESMKSQTALVQAVTAA